MSDISNKTWTFPILHYEILDFFKPSVLFGFLWHLSGQIREGPAFYVGADVQVPYLVFADTWGWDSSLLLGRIGSSGSLLGLQWYFPGREGHAYLITAPHVVSIVPMSAL